MHILILMIQICVILHAGVEIVSIAELLPAACAKPLMLSTLWRKGKREGG